MSEPFAHQAILFHDELRTGTRTELGRKWSPMGHRPISPVHIGYESVYLYLTLCPFTGQGYAAFLPKLNGEWFSWFLRQIESCLDKPALFVADGATAHKAELFTGTKLTFSRLPAACPELNPVERVFKEVRRRLKHRLFASLEQAQERVKAILETLFEGSQTIINLACFPYILNTSQ